MAIDIQLKGFDKVLKKYKNAPKDLAKGITLAMERTALFASTKARENITSAGGGSWWKAPIKTGAMRRGIMPAEKVSGSRPKIFVRPSRETPYAAYVHEGTSSMRSRPFFTYTAEKDSKKIKDFFEKDIISILNKTFK